MQETKSIEQLLELSQNQYYVMTNEERERLDTFLSKRSAQQNPQKDSGSSSESDTPAIVLNKNRVPKETGVIPEEDVHS